MKIVGLISGGKDSCYNLMKCCEKGHQIVCLANLRPPQGVNELDSYMYQSVGHDAIQVYSEAFELPLYRETISGKPILTDYEYAKTEDDEVEDLYKLLARVIDLHPDIQGVSAGAIWSGYQKTRLENVCQRLNLTPLCYLWQMDQNCLMKEIIDSGIEAIIIKVASMGLEPAEHLGVSLSEIYPHLMEMNFKFGANICGEGGEFETFVLDCPLFARKKIRIDESEVIIHSNDAFAKVAYLKLTKLSLENK